jgi:hypothetical protein
VVSASSIGMMKHRTVGADLAGPHSTWDVCAAPPPVVEGADHGAQPSIPKPSIPTLYPKPSPLSPLSPFSDGCNVRIIDGVATLDGGHTELISAVSFGHLLGCLHEGRSPTWNTTQHLIRNIKVSMLCVRYCYACDVP